MSNAMMHGEAGLMAEVNVKIHTEVRMTAHWQQERRSIWDIRMRRLQQKLLSRLHGGNYANQGVRKMR